MTINQAFALRVREILDKKAMKQSQLEKLTGIYHSTMNSLLNNKVVASNSKTMAKIIKALGLSLSEFFDDPIFDFDNIEVE